MTLSTVVDIAPAAVRLTHERPVLMLGSCFTDEIGARLRQSGFEVMCNPFGTLYNPLSIMAALERMQSGIPFDDRVLVQHDQLWHSWCHHGSFSRPDKAEVLRRCNEALDAAARFLAREPIIIVTFGTAYAFFLNDPASPLHGRVVANCHKVPARCFERRRLAVEEIVRCCQLLTARHEVVLTVSPIRHLADGLHGNQLSKATLLLAVEELERQGCCYFPAYELLVDELRDYRFYARDLCHPSDLAADIIYERFQQCCMSADTRQRCLQYQKQYFQSQHRPIHIN